MERDTYINDPYKILVNFNSHAHVERDCDTDSIKFLNYISTHTLTWSVTGIIEIAGIVLVDFNSHAHVERDIIGI